MTLRTDGFASMHADYDGGEFLTKPLMIGKEPHELILNMSTSAAGSINVELLDTNGPLTG